ncbi:MAG: SDR family NAD(P)-dependent oxidoreductase [Cellvibrionaceae bacterium]
MKLKNSCVFVTGAGSGLGRATAELLHSSGACVVLGDINETEVRSVAKKLGERAMAIVVDICSAEQVSQAIASAKEEFGPLRAIVNCAGIPSSAKVISKGEPHSLDVWQKVLDVNLTGTFNVMRLAALAMEENTPCDDSGERGVIVNTASIAAYDGQRGQVAYAASKAGVVGMTLPVARDLAPINIRCVAIAPGLFETEILDGISDKGIEALSKGLLCPERMGSPKEFAAFAKHLIENTYLNGSCYRLDGGARLP